MGPVGRRHVRHHGGRQLETLKRLLRWQFGLNIACFVFVLSARVALAQPSTGTVVGLVKDSTNLIVPQTSVTLLSEQTGRADVRVTDGNGRFMFALVTPGVYQVVVDRAGFARLTKEVTVAVGGTTTVSITLTPAQVATEIVVPAQASPIDSSGGPLRISVPARLLTMLPDFTRNSLNAVNLAAGIDLIPGGYAGTGQMLGADGGTLVANGVRRSQHSYYLDGANNASGWRNTALQMPNPDAVELVQVQSASSGVQFGSQPGAVVNAVTRSGGNTPHLTAFHFFHHRSLNAGRWSDHRAGLPKPDDTQKQSGLTFGGPLVRNRTFIFASFSRFRTNNSTTQVGGRFPTTALKNGDFSEVPDLVAADGSRIPFEIKDPVSGTSFGKTVPALDAEPGLAERFSLCCRRRAGPTRRRCASSRSQPQTMSTSSNSTPGSRDGSQCRRCCCEHAGAKSTLRRPRVETRFQRGVHFSVAVARRPQRPLTDGVSLPRSRSRAARHG